MMLYWQVSHMRQAFGEKLGMPWRVHTVKPACAQSLVQQADGNKPEHDMPALMIEPMLTNMSTTNMHGVCISQDSGDDMHALVIEPMHMRGSRSASDTHIRVLPLSH